MTLNPTIFVYVAGPFSAPTRRGVDANIARAVAVGLEVAKLGFMPIMPHANTAHPEFEKIQAYPFWIDGTTELLRKCDVMVMVPDEEIVLLSAPWPGEERVLSLYSAVDRAEEEGVVSVWCDPAGPVTRGRFASWRESSGALRERDEAARLEIPVFDTLDELRAWTPVKRETTANAERKLIVAKLYREAVSYERNGMQDRAETLRWHAASIENLDHWRAR